MREAISGALVLISVASFMLAPMFGITGEYDYVLTLLTICVITGLVWLILET